MCPAAVSSGARRGRAQLDHVCFRLEPFDQASIRARLAAHGVQAGPAEARYGGEGEGPSIYLQDPERNTIELKGPARVQ